MSIIIHKVGQFSFKLLYFRPVISKPGFDDLEIVEAYWGRALFKDDSILPDATSLRRGRDRCDARHGDH